MADEQVEETLSEGGEDQDVNIFDRDPTKFEKTKVWNLKLGNLVSLNSECLRFVPVYLFDSYLY